jgi:hypothetical protein
MKGLRASAQKHQKEREIGTRRGKVVCKKDMVERVSSSEECKGAKIARRGAKGINTCALVLPLPPSRPRFLPIPKEHQMGAPFFFEMLFDNVE